MRTTDGRRDELLSDEASVGRALFAPLAGLAIILGGLHVANGAALAIQAGAAAALWAAPESVDGSALGLLGPLLVAATAVVLVVARRPSAATGLAPAALALGLLAAADLLNLPARFAPTLEAVLSPFLLIVGAPGRAAGALAGAVCLGLVGTAVLALPAGKGGAAGRLRRVVAGLLAGLVGLNLISTLVAPSLVASAPILDLLEETGEALLAAQALARVGAVLWAFPKSPNLVLSR